MKLFIGTESKVKYDVNHATRETKASSTWTSTGIEAIENGDHCSPWLDSDGNERN